MSCLSRFALTCLTFVILCLGTDAVGQSVVVPNSLESVEGNDGVILINVARLQQVFAASQFSAFGGPRLITGMAFRPDAGEPAFTEINPNVQISLSTTSKSPDGLSITLSENAGADDTVVFSGSLTLSSAASGPPGGPNAFDIIINFTNPFLYDPAAGNLLFDIRSQSMGGIGPAFFLDIEFTSGDSVSNVFELTDGRRRAQTFGLVTQFSYSPAAPELIEDLISDISDLVVGFELKPGQANGLTRPLENALRSIDQGKTEPACNQLQDFIDEVIAKTPPLTVASSDKLIADANAVRFLLKCGD
jgi:hypothetical protein